MDLRLWLFQNRSYTPIPFILLLLIVSHPTIVSLIVGLLMVAVGEWIRIVSVGHAGLETRATRSVGAPELVTTGPYGRARNPLYIGNILMYVGFGVTANVWWLPVLGLVWFGFQYAMIVSREEEFLTKEFGQEYLVYRENVPSFLPRLTGWRKPGNQYPRSTDYALALRSERRTLQALVAVSTLVLVSAYFRGTFRP